MVSPNEEAAAWQAAYDNLFRENETLKRELRVYLEDMEQILKPKDSFFIRVIRKIWGIK